MLNLNQIYWAADECKRQQSGELSVAWLCTALELAVEHVAYFDMITVETITNLARIINGVSVAYYFDYRKVPAVHGETGDPIGIKPELIPRAMQNLLSADLTPTEFYQELEEIHPFCDGNGRLGALLFNMLKDIRKNDHYLKNPVHPPMFEKIA